MNMKNETLGNIPENMASELNDGRSSMRAVVFAALALWLGLVIYSASQGAFVGKADSPPLPIFLGFAVPVAVFWRPTPGGAHSGQLS